MSQKFVQEILNLRGVFGVALILRNAPPYFSIKDLTLGWQKKQVLMQNILQIITKIPQGFEYFEFRFVEYYAYTYELNFNLTLIVLAHTDFTTFLARKVLTFKQVEAAPLEDLDQLLTTFEVLTTDFQPRAVAIENKTLLDRGNSSKNTPKITNKELLKALNNLSGFSSNYMGVKLTAKNLRLTRPNFEWLDNFQINQSAKIEFLNIIIEPVSALQHQWIKQWTAAFIKLGSQILQDFPTLIEQKGLDERDRRLLLTPATTWLAEKSRKQPCQVANTE